MFMKLSFSIVLQKAERQNRNSLMQKAFLANRIAKTVKGFSRKNSYTVKAKALNAIIAKFPNEVEIRQDAALPEMVVVSVIQTRCGLHAPRIALEAYC